MNEFNYYMPDPNEDNKWHKLKKFLHSYLFYIILAVFVALIVLGILLLFRGCSEKKTVSAPIFKGTYNVDDYTVYKFDGRGEGAMCLGENTQYDFKYTVSKNTISLDFADEKVTDTAFTYVFHGRDVTLSDTVNKTTYTLIKQ